MASVDYLSTYIPELDRDNIFVHTACVRGRMSDIFTAEILYTQNGGVKKVALPCSYTFTPNRDMIYICIDQGDSADVIPVLAPLTTT